MKTQKSKTLSDLYPEIKRWSYSKLTDELAEMQSFLNDDNSSIGTSDMYYEQALIEELERRDNRKKI